MNEKLQYATMLDIPVNTCSVTNQIIKKKRNAKKRKVDHDQVKEQLLSKINSGYLEENIAQKSSNTDEFSCDVQVDQTTLNSDQIDETVYNTEPTRVRKKFRFTVIGVQLAVIGVLIATIFLTNAFYAESGMNVFFKSVFGTEEVVEVVDNRTYEQFAPVVSIGGETYAVEDGLITFAGKGSVYAPCDGTISTITTKDDGTFDVEIVHSDNFKTLLCGLEFVYASEGDGVFGNIPVGYYNGENANMCFLSGDGLVISDYKIIDNFVVWEV